MSPYLFNLKLTGHLKTQRSSAFYFRELFALIYNVNRGEKQEAIDGTDVLTLPGEKKRKPSKQAKLPKRSAQEWEAIIARIAKS